MKPGLIGDIGRHRTGDGPGIRSLVFFKGCPLACPWCHNPEFIAPAPELALYPARCLGCGDCLAACPQQALTLTPAIEVDRRRCTVCGDCATVCPTRALAPVGRSYDLRDLVDELLRDRLYWQVSNGGVTLSGGEPTAQMVFAGALLERLHRQGVHTAIETCGFFPWTDFASRLLPWCDLLLIDLKIADGRRHAELTGQGNEIIFANLAKAVSSGHEVIVRIPLIPGFTAEQENLAGLAAVMKRCGVTKCTLLPYHPFGLAKAGAIGRQPCFALPERPMSRAEADQWRRCFTEFQQV
ncbi:MAG: glycyl-radical enzyme activating protein [Thermodesulfobacteriota bacterium]